MKKILFSFFVFFFSFCMFAFMLYIHCYPTVMLYKLNEPFMERPETMLHILYVCSKMYCNMSTIFNFCFVSSSYCCFFTIVFISEGLFLLEFILRFYWDVKLLNLKFKLGYMEGKFCKLWKY